MEEQVDQVLDSLLVVQVVSEPLAAILPKRLLAVRQSSDISDAEGGGFIFLVWPILVP